MSVTTETSIIRGARPSDGSMEGGITWDYTELYIEEHIDPENGSGTATVPLKWGKRENYDNHIFNKIKFPVKAQIDIMTVTNGRGSSKRVVTAVRFEKAPNNG
jgi:hypothetical protein